MTHATRHVLSLALLTLLALALLGAYGYLLRDTLTHGRTLAILKAEVASHQAEARTLLLSRRMLESSAADRARLGALTVSEDELVRFLEAVESLGTHTGATVSFTALATEERALRLDLVAEGSFADVAYFLALIEGLPQPLAMKRLNMSARDDGQWEATLAVEVYSFKPHH